MMDNIRKLLQDMQEERDDIQYYGGSSYAPAKDAFFAAAEQELSALLNGYPMEDAPDDGTRIIAWIPQRGLFEIIRWEMPHDRSGARAWCLDEYVQPYELRVACPPARWWPLPITPTLG